MCRACVWFVFLIKLFYHCTEERRQRELLYKAERKKQRLQLEVDQRKAKQEYKQQKELRSYSYVANIPLPIYLHVL